MPYEDSERVSNFYSQAFGWQLMNIGEEMGNYVLAGTTETDENQMVKTPGNINGGFYPKAPDANPHPSVVIQVADVAAASEKVKAAGGELIGEPVEIPGVGLWVAFTDTEGNRVSILQPPS